MKINDQNALRSIAHEVRQDIIEMGLAAGGEGAHMGGSLSIVEIVVALYFSVMNNPVHFEGYHDRLILSKGHGVQAQYACLHQLGIIGSEEIRTFKHDGSRLTAHPAVNSDFGFDFATGSLGQGLSLGVGQALAIKRHKDPSSVYVSLGDGECDEGSIWEAALSASQYHLNNLIAIIDNNNLQYDDSVEDVMSLDSLSEKWRAFGWNAIEVDGHSFGDLIDAFAINHEKPLVIIAHTTKGKGISFMENNPCWHHGVVNKKVYGAAMAEMER